MFVAPSGVGSPVCTSWESDELTSGWHQSGPYSQWYCIWIVSCWSLLRNSETDQRSTMLDIIDLRHVCKAVQITPPSGSVPIVSQISLVAWSWKKQLLSTHIAELCRWAPPVWEDFEVTRHLRLRQPKQTTNQQQTTTTGRIRDWHGLTVLIGNSLQKLTRMDMNRHAISIQCVQRSRLRAIRNSPSW